MAYSDFYDMTYKWNIKIGRIYGTVFENGHIIVGLPKKVQQKFGQPGNFDLSELKWVIFDECDQLKENSLHEFTDLLRDPKIGSSGANVLPYLCSLLSHQRQETRRTSAGSSKTTSPATTFYSWTATRRTRDC